MSRDDLIDKWLDLVGIGLLVLILPFWLPLALIGFVASKVRDLIWRES